MTSLVLTTILLMFVIHGSEAASLRDYDDAAASTMTGHLYALETATGAQHRLHRRDIEAITKVEHRHVRLHMNDGSPPMLMHLRQGCVWSRRTRVFVRRGGRRMRVHHSLSGSCYLHGRVVSHGGTVSINRCGRMTGKIIVPGHHYDLKEVTSSKPHTQFKVTKKEENKAVPIVMDDLAKPQMSEKKATSKSTSKEDSSSRKKRVTKKEENKAAPIVMDDLAKPQMSEKKATSKSTSKEDSSSRKKREARQATVELAIFADANALGNLAAQGIDTTGKVVDYFVSKWNAIQAIYDSVENLGFEIKFDVKTIELWWDNPPHYLADTATDTARLTWFSQNTPEGDYADLRVLYTIETGYNHLGIAIQNGTCKNNVFFVKSLSDSIFLELHELGHSLGLPHEPMIPNCTASPTGFMAWDYNIIFKDCYSRALLKNIGNLPCLFTEDMTEESFMETPSTKF